MFKSIVASVLLFALPLVALELVSNGNFEQSPASKNKVPQSWQEPKSDKPEYSMRLQNEAFCNWKK